MTDNKRQLEVGDVIYGFEYSRFTSKMTVTRVTKTLAICQSPWNKDCEMKFKRNCSGYISMIEKSSWCNTDYQLATPELDKKFVVAQMCNRIKQVKWEHISEDILKKVCELLG